MISAVDERMGKADNIVSVRRATVCIYSSERNVIDSHRDAIG